MRGNELRVYQGHCGRRVCRAAAIERWFDLLPLLRRFDDAWGGVCVLRLPIAHNHLGLVSYVRDAMECVKPTEYRLIVDGNAVASGTSFRRLQTATGIDRRSLWRSWSGGWSVPYGSDGSRGVVIGVSQNQT